MWTLLDEDYSKELLEAYGLARPRHVLVASDDVTMAYTRFQASADLRYPVVVKVHGGELAHKTAEGGVVLGVRDDGELMRAVAELRAGFPGHGLLIEEQVPHLHEFLVGMVHDPTFGPVVSFGTGGVLTEVFDDVAFRAVPVDRVTACHMVHSTRIGGTFSSDPAMRPDVSGIVEVIMAVSRLAVELGHVVAAVEVNPLAWTGEAYVALDAKVQLVDRVIEEWKAVTRPGGPTHGDAKRQVS